MVVRLVPPKVNRDSIKVLEHLLEMAEKGEIVSLVCVAECTGDRSATSFVITNNRTSMPNMIYGLEQIKHRLLTRGD